MRAIEQTHSEIKAQYLFEKELSETKFPQYQDLSFASQFKLGFYSYLSLLIDRSASLCLYTHLLLTMITEQTFSGV